MQRLKHVASVHVSNVDKKSNGGETGVRLCNYTDVYYNERITSELSFMEATASDTQIAEFRLQPGDVVITKDSEVAEDIAVPAAVDVDDPSLVCGYHLAIIRPDPKRIHPRFLFWSMAARPTREWFASEAKGVTRFGLRSDSIANVLINVPRLGMQRSVADYLDRETSRIDALVEKKRRMVRLAEDSHQLRASALIWRDVPRTVPLMYRTQWDRPIMYGIVLPGPSVPHGVPIVKGGDVAAGRLSPELLSRTTPEIEAPYARARLAPGDLVFAIRGGIGDVDIVPKALAGANITQDVARIAPDSDVDPQWLQVVLKTDNVRHQVGARTTGATIKGLNIWDLKRIRIPSSSPARQAADLRFLTPEFARIQRLAASLGRQIELLVEHRQALITAAVTGQLDRAMAAA